MKENIKMKLGARHQTFQLLVYPTRGEWSLKDEGEVVMIGRYNPTGDKKESTLLDYTKSVYYFRKELFLLVNDRLFRTPAIERLKLLNNNAWIKANNGESTKESIAKMTEILYHYMDISFEVMERRGGIYLFANECEVNMDNIIERLETGIRIDDRFLQAYDVLK